MPWCLRPVRSKSHFRRHVGSRRAEGGLAVQGSEAIPLPCRQLAHQLGGLGAAGPVSLFSMTEISYPPSSQGE